MLYMIAWAESDKPGIEQEAWRKFCGAQVGIDLDPQFRKIRNRENNYLQDRKAMKLGDFTGIRGFPNQDIAMWETMGAHHGPHQGAARRERPRDRGIPPDHGRGGAHASAMAARRSGRVPSASRTSSCSSFEGIVPKSTNWQTLAVAQEELAQTASGHSATG